MFKFLRSLFKKDHKPTPENSSVEFNEDIIKTVPPPCARNTSFWLPPAGDSRNNYLH